MKAMYLSAVLLLFSFAPNVSAQTVCTMEYAPVCGAKEVQCVTEPCLPVQQTYGNACMAQADGADIIHTGECGAAQSGPISSESEQSVTYEPPASCTAWYDGCNSCSRGENGQAICTLRYCENPDVGYCTNYETNNEGKGTTANGNATSSLQVWQWGTASSGSLNGGFSLVNAFFANIAQLFSWIPFFSFR